jgi:hypothetical protein
MSGINYLIGSEKTDNTPQQTFSDEICTFMNELSTVLRRSPSAHTYPDISALAFWCRKGNIQKLKDRYDEKSERLGRGICFHVTPSNIPINFAFSWLFSLLAGNANIVRLPSKDFPQVPPVLDAIAKTMEKYPDIARRTAFVRYPAGNAVTAEFCAKADARMIWGGDSTIASIKSLPTKPRCVDIAFADRYSICIIDGKAVLNANVEDIKRLAQNFYNDTYLMDQNACSSPQLILWSDDSAEARERFWQSVFDCAEKKYQLQAAVVVDKYTQMCEDAVSLNIVRSVSRNGNLLYRVELDALRPDMTEIRGEAGYFYEYAISCLDEIKNIITEKFQTVTYFGIDPFEIRRFVITNNLRGIDRIVPVGRAMDISIIWDGFEIVCTLSRIVSAE